MNLLQNINWFLPEIFLTIAICIILLLGVFITKFGGKINQLHKIIWYSIITLFITSILLLNQYIGDINNNNIVCVGGLLITNEFLSIIKFFLVNSSIIILLLSLKSIISEKIFDYEFPLLILLSTLGMMLLLSSNDLIMFYLSIELLSLSFYVLAGAKRKSLHSTEASLKYFLLGALSSGILLFGMALLYAFTGETNFIGLTDYIWFSNNDIIIIAGASLIIISILFKLAAAPFHMWAPDVYEGSPTIVTAYFAIVPKIAMIFVLMNLLRGPFIGIFNNIQFILVFAISASLIIGSIGALNQTKIKRMLAYSAITHVGFLLLGILPNSILSIQATFIYIILYIIMSFNSFTFILNTFKHGNFISQLSGLSRYNPVLAFTFAFTLLSIAGIPPLAGFFSKYLILNEVIKSEFYILALIAIIASTIAGFYYLRIIKWMFFKDTTYFNYKDIGDVIYPINTSTQVSLIHSLILGGTLYIIFTFLLYPTPLLTLTNNLIITSLL